jgi:CheY-like chemotaxis protein
VHGRNGAQDSEQRDYGGSDELKAWWPAQRGDEQGHDVEHPDAASGWCQEIGNQNGGGCDGGCDGRTVEQLATVGARLVLEVDGFDMLSQTGAGKRSTAPGSLVAEGNSAETTQKSPAHILVVDDEPLVRWSVSETLSEEGYEVSEAADGASAIQALSPATHADVVLLDLRLPDCDDLHVLSAVRRLAPTTPVIVMTAYGTPESLKEAHRLGAFAVLDKPFEMDALVPLVEHALDSRPR